MADTTLSAASGSSLACHVLIYELWSLNSKCPMTFAFYPVKSCGPTKCETPDLSLEFVSIVSNSELSITTNIQRTRHFVFESTVAPQQTLVMPVFNCSLSSISNKYISWPMDVSSTTTKPPLMSGVFWFI